jgi:hypothetical protein
MSVPYPAGAQAQSMPVALTQSGPTAAPHVLRTFGIGFVLLMAAGVMLRIAFLGQQSLWFDEGVGLIFSGCSKLSDCLDRMLDTRTSERFQLVYPLLLHLWRQAFGDTEIALRSLSVLFGIAAMPMIWATAWRSFGATHANWTLAFAAFSAFTLIHAQEARPYTLFLFLAAAQVWLFMSARRGSQGARIGLCLVTATASWVGLFPLLFSVALALADLADRPWRLSSVGAWLVWWLPVGLLCVPAVIYYGIAAAGMSPDQVRVPKSDNLLLNLVFVVYGHLVGQTFGPPVEALRTSGRLAALIANAHWLVLFAALMALAGVRAVQVLGSRLDGKVGTDARVLLFALLSYIALSFVFAIVTRHNWLPRHAIALHPLVALLLPLLAGGRAIVGRLRIGQAVLGGILLLNTVAVAQHYFNQAHWKDDYRGTAEYLRQIGEPQRPVLVLRGLPVLLAYYGYDDLTSMSDPPRDRVAAIVRRAAHGRPEIVLVVNREADLWPPGWLDEALASDFRPLAARRFTYFAVYTYARR